MAANTAHAAKTFTTSAGSADTLVLTQYGAIIQIYNPSASVPLYATFGVSTTATTTPTVGGDNCYVVPPAQVLSFPYPTTSAGSQVCVATISASAITSVTIQVIPTRAF